MKLMKVNKKVVAIASATLIMCVAASVITCMKEKKRNRRFAIRSMNRNRDKEGIYATLIHDMRAIERDHEQFFKYTRMTPNLFEYLLELVGPSLKKDVTKNPLSPEHRLLMTKHYLAEGCSMQELAWNYRVGKTTAHKMIRETCSALWSILAPIHIPVPDNQRWTEISEEFYKRWNMPNCVGAVDGKHINIQAPNGSGSEFFNYKKNFSMVLMAVCDAYYRFTLVDIGASGSNHDSEIFKSSSFGQAMLKGELGIPRPKNLPNSNIKMNHFIVGDAAFPLHKNILRPYPGKYLDEKKNIFNYKKKKNYRLSRARRTIENTFGILTTRWRIFRKPIVASIETCELIVQAAIVLHNFIQNCEKDIPVAERKYCPTGFVDFYDSNGDIHPVMWGEEHSQLKSVNRLSSNNATRSTIIMRDSLADYFTSREGCLSWQEDHVYRGGVPYS